jgi:hypothetical protein
MEQPVIKTSLERFTPEQIYEHERILIENEELDPSERTTGSPSH